MKTTNPTDIHLDADGTSGVICDLTFDSRAVHRLLAEVDPDDRPGVARDALELGAEVLERTRHHGDLEQISAAIERLDEEGRRIVESTTTSTSKVIDETIAKLSEMLGREDGPLSGMYERFDPKAEGNVVDQFRDLVATGIAKATKSAVAEMAESTRQQMESLTKSITALEQVAAVEAARAAEAEVGARKGLDHEDVVETMLGELTAVAGDGIDDVSTVTGMAGSKKGDKVITVRGGVPIVTEDKCTKRMSESKIRDLLVQSMENRGTPLAMFIVEDESKVPGNQPFHLIDDDKVVVVAERTVLRLVYCLMRSRAVELAAATGDVDDDRAAAALIEIRTNVDQIRRALKRFQGLRTEHTKAANAIESARAIVDDVERSIVTEVSDIAASVDGAVADELALDAA